MLKYVGNGCTVELHLALPHRGLTENEVGALTSLTKGGKVQWNRADLIQTGSYADDPPPDPPAPTPEPGEGEGEG